MWWKLDLMNVQVNHFSLNVPRQSGDSLGTLSLSISYSYQIYTTRGNINKKMPYFILELTAFLEPKGRFRYKLGSPSSRRSNYTRLQNSPYFCVFKHAREVKQKVWNEAENSERDWRKT